MPYRSDQVVADANVLSDFCAVGGVELLWRVFPSGIWIDAGALHEVKPTEGFNLDTHLGVRGLPYFVERDFDETHYAEMAEIKARRRGLRHPDIACIVIARKRGLPCLSGDGAVRAVCEERGVLVSGHLGVLGECVARGLITGQDAIQMLTAFEDGGAYFPLDVSTDLRRQWSR